MVKRTQHQLHDTEPITRTGFSFTGFQQLRDKTTFEIVPESEYQTAYKITFREYVEEWTEHRIPHKFVYYQLSRRSNKGTEQIGRITTYTTEDRLRSLLYRYFNPDHAQGLSFYGRVRLSGSADEISGEPGERLPSKMPYIVIPSDDVDKCDLRVDDEIQYTIINGAGERYTERYHLSLTAKPLDGSTRSLILPLTRIKRLVVFDDGTARMRYLKKEEYDNHTRDLENNKPLTIELPHYKKGKVDSVEIIPVHRFINEGDEVSVTINPEEWTKHQFMDRRGRFDFVINTLQLIQSKRRSEEKWLAEHPEGIPVELLAEQYGIKLDDPEEDPEEGEQ